MFLRGLYGDENVAFDPKSEHRSWSISLRDGNSTEPLQAHAGLLLSKEAAVAKRSEYEKRDNLYWNALNSHPEDDEQTKTTREFLHSKISNPANDVIEIRVPGTNHILAWGHLQLTSEAKAAVQAYKGVDSRLGEDSEVTDDRAITSLDDMETRQLQKKHEFAFPATTPNNIEKRAGLFKRAFTYVKQTHASDHLIMTSRPW
jgi:hypothetical protein